MSIYKLVSGNSRKWQLVLLVLGAFMGFLLTWLPLQLYFDISSALSTQKDLLSNNYFIISKPVSLLNTLGLPTNGFATEEINELKNQPFVSQAAPFLLNRFKADINVGVPNTSLNLYTEIFFESVPNAFIDELPGGWNWNPNSAEVPVIVPSDYFNLYNFGFAAGQGLPQISGSAAKLIAFTINIQYNHLPISFKGRIVGFSDRINSILVPETFMNYANKNFALKTVSNPVRLIVEVKDAAAFSKYLNEKGYETNNETLRSGEIKSLSKIIIQVVLLFGILIIILSLGLFIQFADLAVARAEYEIQTLNYLGYYYSAITLIFFRYLLMLVAFAAALALVAGFLTRQILLRWFSNFFDSPVEFNVLPLLILALITGFYLLINYLNLLYHCRKLSLTKK